MDTTVIIGLMQMLLAFVISVPCAILAIMGMARRRNLAK